MIIKRRVVTKNLPLSGTVFIAVMSGKQRDTLVAQQSALRQQILSRAGTDEAAMSVLKEAEQKKVILDVLKNDEVLLSKFNEQQYQLICWCIFDAERGEPMWATPEDVATSIDYEQATELSDAVSTVNKLTSETLKQEQLDFFGAPKDGPGSSSPAPSADPV